MGVQTDNKETVQLKDKLNLTIKEAVMYSNIGESMIRKMLHEKGCPFLLKIGNRHLVKRIEFEKYIESKHFL